MKNFLSRLLLFGGALLAINLVKQATTNNSRVPNYREPPEAIQTPITPVASTKQVTKGERTLNQETLSHFSREECYRKYFPIALGIPDSAIPPEVKFYCAYNWDVQTFETFRSILKGNGFDPVGAIVRSVADNKKALLQRTTKAALDAAEKGPPGMGAVYLAHTWLPVLYLLKTNEKGVEFIKTRYAEEDLAILSKSASQINWTSAAILGLENGAQTNSHASITLAEVSAIILSRFEKK